ncbi:invasion associated locus B family protein [Roseobacter sp. HKCCD9010]|uniref:invasion associated locus B family protein n=1 Tax=unclassified Roseobacter TaxID=196798 RepID=UPI0014917E20|nr:MULTISPECIES: invasion associated locus B family protein [unclassified Roseobacter]MBF9050279.1 invasion associated locus B family protein [Rhodobacterales bacterium HKCCD4356]NNV12522.1 invasion associated locus B family protein [Roseobacter sp. HKCCD7357]NNV16013.1 invasion associated locus B family protein [Roseobacter sp. HKCCD8768]NNV25473.1 invasion associated locus B family protein [Roseobacter sp. HKCCD8192]NNV29730.1 invasion associated locus B family protein [Roseobacter sp. HKCCD
MKPALPLIPALLALVLAGPAFSQDTATDGAEDAAVETDPTIDPQTGLSLGTPVEDPNGIGSTYISATHGAWEIRCIRVEEGQPEPCQMYQLLSDEGGNPVAEFNLFDIPDEGNVIAGATIVTPLDTLLLPQLQLRIDSGQAQRYPFSFCQQIGCFVRLGLSEADIAAFRAGANAVVSIVPLPAPDQVVELSASLTGFTAAYNDLIERSAAFEALQE